MTLDELHAQNQMYANRRQQRAGRLADAMTTNVASKHTAQDVFNQTLTAADNALAQVMAEVNSEAQTDLAAQSTLIDAYEAQLRTWDADIHKISAAMRAAAAEIDPPPDPPTSAPSASFT